MYLKELNREDNKELDFVKNLYLDSFPESERRETNTMFDLHSCKDNAFVIQIVIKDDRYVGFLTYWDFEDYVYAEHFAISPEFRNGGFGGKVMELFMKLITHPIVLEVELPNTILSERRIGFYQRLGFKLWEDIPYQQPPYSKDGNPVPMKLMTYGAIDLDKDLQKVRDEIYREVYNY